MICYKSIYQLLLNHRIYRLLLIIRDLDLLIGDSHMISDAHMISMRACVVAL
jgi:hypothetical protein